MFILAPERDEDPVGAFNRYREYVATNSHRFPAGALSLVTSDWYFGADGRSPHDAWLERMTFSERSPGSRDGCRRISLEIELLSAHHDLSLTFQYENVRRYQLQAADISAGHRDWRYDEFRINDQGRLVHEIQWHGPSETANWVIEADDVAFSSSPRH